MCCVINSNTINIGEEYTADFFMDLKNKFYFSYEILHLKEHAQIIKDMDLEEKLSNDNLFNALLLQDYDVRNYILTILDVLLSITDISETAFGTQDDVYSYEGKEYKGDQYSFVELAFENNWNIISFEAINLDNMSSLVIKNGRENKKIFNLCNITQWYLLKSLTCEQYLEKYFSSFDKVYCIKNCANNWEDINNSQRLKILSTFYREVEYVVHNKFNKLGHFPGKNTNRVEKINDNLFEYRLSNPNYRIYYTRRDENLVIVLCMLKKQGKISKTIMDNLMYLKTRPYMKIVE